LLQLWGCLVSNAQPLRLETLDDEGNCVAAEVQPGVWHIKRVDPFGKIHIVILTAATIRHLAEIL
jgi:hypothetical protein